MQDDKASSVDDMFLGSVTVGERGQIVIPAEARKAYNIQPGDRLLVLRQPHRGKPGALILAKMGDLQELMTDMGRFLNAARARIEQADNNEEE